MREPQSEIICVDCGGTAHLLTRPHVDDEDPTVPRWEADDIVSYRCSDCLDRWDLVLTDEDLEDPDDDL